MPSPHNRQAVSRATIIIIEVAIVAIFHAKPQDSIAALRILTDGGATVVVTQIAVIAFLPPLPRSTVTAGCDLA